MGTNPVGTPLGDFVRARRDATRPEALGLPAGPRRRVPGLRRSELAALAGISVEYLVRLEQGRDRSPSVSVLDALADALRLDAGERDHLGRLAKRAAGVCRPRSDGRLQVRPTVRALLAQLEPGVALLTNHAGDVLAHTTGFELLARPTGLLDATAPNLTRFVFTDARARTLFPDWSRVADDRIAALTLGPPAERAERLVAELTATVGAEFTDRLARPGLLVPAAQRWRHPEVGELRLIPEVLELPAADAQQLVVFLPADDATADALLRLRHPAGGALRAVP